METQKIKNKNLSKWLVLLLSVVILTISMAGTAMAGPSIYAITDLTTTPYPVKAYNIDGDNLGEVAICTISDKGETLIPLNVAIDDAGDGEGFLFIARQGTDKIDLIDVNTLPRAVSAEAKVDCTCNNIEADHE